jgi:hypothetical protein
LRCALGPRLNRGVRTHYMVAEHLKGKYEAQTAELYQALGKFVVKFEHLMWAAKHRINLLCGLSQESSLLLEPYTPHQTIDLLNDLIRQRAEKLSLTAEDQELFRALVSDLRSVTSERNKVIHTTWYIGWCSEKDTDFSEAHGHKFSSQMNFKAHKVNAAIFESLSSKCDSLYRVMFTMWPIEIIEEVRGPPLASLFSRTPAGLWSRK